MKINQFEAFKVRFELTNPYITAEYKGKGLSEKHCVVVRLRTDDGLVGYGETDGHAKFTYEGPESVMSMLQHYLAPAVLGMDPRNLSALHERMDQTVPRWPFAKAPINIACHDLWGKSLGLPIYKLLGGELRDRVPMIWPIGGGSPEENVQQVSQKVADGYQSFHIKIGAFHPDLDVARVAAIRQEVGPQTPLMLDANQGWDYLTAKRTIARLEPYHPAWSSNRYLPGIVMGCRNCRRTPGFRSVPTSRCTAFTTPRI